MSADKGKGDFSRGSDRQEMPLRSPGGEQQKDETESGAREQDLEEYEQRFRVQAGIVPVMVYVIDENGNFVFISDPEMQLGYAPEELIGEHFRKIIHPDDFPNCQRGLLRYLQGLKTGDEKAPGLFDERRGSHRRAPPFRVRLVPKFGDDPLMCEIRASGISQRDSEGQLIEARGTIGFIVALITPVKD